MSRQGGYGSRGGSFGERGKTKVLFVKNLSYDTTEESLKDAFKGCLSARIATFADSGKPRGFGFVEFDSVEDAADAYDDMNGAEVDGRELKVDFASERNDRDRSDNAGSWSGAQGGGRGRSYDDRDRGYSSRDRGRDGGRGGSYADRGKTKVLFVKNLSYDTTEESLEEAFEGCSSARIAYFSDSGKPRGFGFVEFNTVEDAEESFDRMTGQEVDGRVITLDFASERSDNPGGRGGRGGGGGGYGGPSRGRGGRGRGRGPPRY